jgi:hypothetical protein
MEYDTYRDPVGPISASTQVLVGAIANFVTGLADVPMTMVSDIVSAGRAIGNPQNHTDPRNACGWKERRRMRRGETSESDDSSQREGSNEQSSSTPTATPDLVASDDESSLDDSISVDDPESDTPATNIDRQRSLQLEKSCTMASCPKAAEQKKSAVSEMQYHGGRMSKKFLKTVIWLPTDLTLSLSKGFHNAPKLYHDPMVESTPKVIGFRSGLRAARKVCGHEIAFVLTSN